MTTETEAREIQAAINTFQQKDADAQKVINDNNVRTAQTWFDALPQIIKTPITRDDALFNFNEIESLQTTETDSFRQQVLSNELIQANEEYKQVKRTG